MVFLVREGVLFVVDSGNHRIRTIEADTIRIVAGNGTDGYSGDGGPATDASLNGPMAVYVDHDGNVYFADTDNHRIRRLEAESGIVITVAGSGRSGQCRVDIPATKSKRQQF
ncbi:MAG TPA: hypothetical protein DIU35_16970 [Candidatus Latescibacteria bacterium]|nr:hypothetical protein [Candidatus Latescibacterota bacterium]